jgi:hypothetical protein
MGIFLCPFSVEHFLEGDVLFKKVIFLGFPEIKDNEYKISSSQKDSTGQEQFVGFVGVKYLQVLFFFYFNI